MRYATPMNLPTRTGYITSELHQYRFSPLLFQKQRGLFAMSVGLTDTGLRQSLQLILMMAHLRKYATNNATTANAIAPMIIL